MNKNLHDIDKLFRDALDDHSESAPAGAWDGVSSHLDQQQADSFRQKYVRMKRMALVLLLLVFTGTASLLYFGLPGNKFTSTAANQKTRRENESATTNANSAAGTPAAAEKAAVKNEEAAIKEPGAAAPAQPAATHNETKQADSPLAAETTAPGHTNLNNNGVDKNGIATENAGASVETNAAAHTQKAAEAKRLPGNTANTTAKNVLSSSNNKTRGKNNYAVNTAAETGDMRAPSIAKGNSRSGKNVLAAANAKKQKGSHGDVLSTVHASQNTGEAEVAGRNINSNNKYQQQAAQSQSITRQVTPLAPYLYQAPLSGEVGAIETADLFVPVNSTALLHELAKSKLAAKAAPSMKPLNHHAVSLTVFGSPNRSFTRLVNDMQPWGRGWGKEAAEREEKQGSSYSVGVLVNYNLNKHFILQSGVVYSSATTNISPKIIYARPDNNGHTRYEFNCSSGLAYISPKSGATPAVGDSIKVMGSNSTISYIGIPLSLNYVWQIGRFAVKPGIGIGINFLTNGKSATTFGGQGYQKEQTQISGLRKAYLDGSVGLGAEYQLSRRIAIGVRPLLRMAVTSINKNTPVRTYQNFMSYETGLRINL